MFPQEFVIGFKEEIKVAEVKITSRNSATYLFFLITIIKSQSNLSWLTELSHRNRLLSLKLFGRTSHQKSSLILKESFKWSHFR